MADVLTPAERAAIAAFDKRKVRRIEQGTYTQPVRNGVGVAVAVKIIRPGQAEDDAETVKVDQSKRMKRIREALLKAERERAADRARGDAVGRQKPARKTAPTKPRRRKKPTGRPVNAELRATYVRLVAEGLTRRQICERLGVAYSSVSSNCERYGLKPRSDLHSGKPESARRAARISAERRQAETAARYRALAAEGLTAKQAAARLGITVGTVYGSARRYGVEFAPDPDKGWRGARKAILSQGCPDCERLRARVAELEAQLAGSRHAAE